MKLYQYFILTTLITLIQSVTFASLSCDQVLVSNIFTKIDALSEAKAKLLSGDYDHNIKMRSQTESTIQIQLSKLVKDYPWSYQLFVLRTKELQLTNGDSGSLKVQKAQEIKKQIDRDDLILKLFGQDKYRFNYLKYVESLEGDSRQFVLETIFSWKNSTDANERTIFERFKEHSMESVFTKKGFEVETLKVYMQKNYLDINDVYFSGSNTLLQLAIRSLSSSVAEFVLNDPNFNLINHLDRNLDSVLHIAIQNGMTSVANQIMNRPDFALINHAGYAGNTVLHQAINLGSVEIVCRLSGHSQFTAWDHKNSQGLTPLEYAREKKQKTIALLIKIKQAQLKVQSLWR